MPSATDDILPLVEDYIKRLNGERCKAYFTSLAHGYNHAKVRVEHIKGVVLRGQRWWEAVEVSIYVYTVTHTPDGSATTLDDVAMGSSGEGKVGRLPNTHNSGHTQVPAPSEQVTSRCEVSLEIDAFYATSGSMPSSITGYKDIQTSRHSQSLYEFARKLRVHLESELSRSELP